MLTQKRELPSMTVKQTATDARTGCAMFAWLSVLAFATGNLLLETDARGMNIRYEPRGLLDAYDLANGTTTAHKYDSRSQLQSLTTAGPGATTLQGYTYARDRVGNIVAIDDLRAGGGAWTSAARYEYDAWYRLTSARLDPGTPHEETLGFTHDTIDNLTSMRSSVAWGPIDLGAYTYGPRKGHEAGPHALSWFTAGITHLYDAAGQVTHRNSLEHAWDHQGRLTEVKRGPQWIERYGYAGGWDRVVKRERGETSLYVADDFELRDGVATTYVRIGGQRVVKIEEGGLAARAYPDLSPAGAPDGRLTAADARALARAGAQYEEVEGVLKAAAAEALLRGVERVTYLHGDHLGTTSVTTDELGAEVSRMLHYPYGWVRLAEPQLEDYGWTGQERDDPVDLSNHSARLLVTREGRWLSPDPLFRTLGKEALERPFEAANPYTYSLGNPINNTDPNGTCAITPDGSIDCVSGIQAARSDLMHAVNEALGEGRYGSALLGVALHIASNVNLAAGYAAQLTIAGSYNSGHDAVTGFVDGDYGQALRGSIGLLTFGLGAKLVSPSLVQAPARGNLVIGKLSDLTRAGALRDGERTLLPELPNLGSPKANWAQNSGRLRAAMRERLPIRDASVDPSTGALINNTGFLRAERYLLESRGWVYEPTTTTWQPPVTQ